MTNTSPAIAYPEGEVVGRIVSGRDKRSGKTRHVAFDLNKNRIGTFDRFADARDELVGSWRGVVETPAEPEPNVETFQI